MSQYSLATMIRHHLGATDMSVMFDVGANVGQTALALKRDFPHSAIYAFEPVESTFKTLIQNTREAPEIKTFRLALGKTSGSALMTNDPDSVGNSILRNHTGATNSALVEMACGDEFCEKNAIGSIGYLKIDAEGHDFDVLVGFAHMLAAQRIAVLEVEASMSSRNRRHAPLEHFRCFLEPIGYSLFHIYDMVFDVSFSGRPHMRRANVVFVSENAVVANIKPTAQQKKTAPPVKTG